MDADEQTRNNNLGIAIKREHEINLLQIHNFLCESSGLNSVQKPKLTKQ